MTYEIRCANCNEISQFMHDEMGSIRNCPYCQAEVKVDPFSIQYTQYRETQILLMEIKAVLEQIRDNLPPRG